MWILIESLMGRFAGHLQWQGKYLYSVISLELQKPDDCQGY